MFRKWYLSLSLFNIVCKLYLLFVDLPTHLKSFSSIALALKNLKLWKVEVQNQAKFYVQICPIFAGLVPLSHMAGIYSWLYNMVYIYSPFCSIFYLLYAFEQCSKKLPVMLNIVPMTAIMPQFVYDFIICND